MFPHQERITKTVKKLIQSVSSHVIKPSSLKKERTEREELSNIPSTDAV